jgi:hypothetical protein
VPELTDFASTFGALLQLLQTLAQCSPVYITGDFDTFVSKAKKTEGFDKIPTEEVKGMDIMFLDEKSTGRGSFQKGEVSF